MENEIKRTRYLYIAAVLSVFTVAGGLIEAPFSSAGLLAFFIAVFLGVLTAAVSAPLVFRLFAARPGRALKCVFFILSVPALAAALFSAKEYCDFIYGAVLYRSGITAVKAVFAVCVFCLAVSCRAAVYKFSLISAVAVSAAFAIMFLLSGKTFDIKNLADVFDTGGLSARDIWTYYQRMFLPSVAAVGFICAAGAKHGAGVAVGAACGILPAVIVIFDSVLSFGLPLAANLDYPYIGDISTVTVGSLFTRMDGFAYMAFFACHLIKSAVCIRLSVLLLERAGTKDKKIPAALFCASILLV